jgi:hypothetical protein
MEPERVLKSPLPPSSWDHSEDICVLEGPAILEACPDRINTRNRITWHASLLPSNESKGTSGLDRESVDEGFQREDEERNGSLE